MIRGWDSRMVAMSEVERLALKQGGVRGVGSTDDGERASERIDHFLQVPRLRHHAFRAPAPAWRKLPRTEMHWEFVSDSEDLGFGGHADHTLHARLGQHLLGVMRELGDEGDIGENLNIHLLDAMLAAVVARCALQRWNVQRHADHAPQRAWPTLLPIGVYRVELQHLATRREYHTLAVRKHLLAVVTDDAQVDHVADGLRKRIGRSLRRASHSR